jgi:hypothetical protein
MKLTGCKVLSLKTNQAALKLLQQLRDRLSETVVFRSIVAESEFEFGVN